MSLYLWGLLCLCLTPLVRAGTIDVQDNDPGMVYSAGWTPDGSPLAHGSHETWTNVSGASVYYDFLGTQVKLFATMRPTGTYLTNVSFAIDNDKPTFWTSSDPVLEDTFNKLVYTSAGSLSSDHLHRITVTNYGKIFWLVYLEITTVDASSTGTQSSTPAAGPTNTASPQNSNSGKSSHTPLIVGVVVGVVGGVSLLVALLWCWRMHSKARQRQLAAVAATPFAGQSTSPHFSKDHPPTAPPSRFPLGLGRLRGSQSAASDSGYGDLSEQSSDLPTNPRRQSPLPNVEALKQLGIMREAEAARADPEAPSLEAQPQPSRPLPAPPHMRLSPGTGSASIPSVPETPYPSTTRTSTGAPVARSGWLVRALTFSSARYHDPALASSTPSSPMPSAIASSPILPPPSAGSRGSVNAHRSVFFRMLRRERDGGVRLAGGSPQERNADMCTPEEYDQVLEAMSERSTLPPSYQQHHVSANSPRTG